MKDFTTSEIGQVMDQAWQAYLEYRSYPLSRRAAFMRAVAVELEAAGDDVIQTAMRETNLPEARLRGERARTMFQLTSYADACEKGDWLEARIDTAIPAKTPPRPDIRKMMVPLGPVVVFGASNFPFAYSTAGGDTASAFAAGCPVIVKAHPAHAATSELVAAAISRAAASTGMPAGIFSHVQGTSFQVGKDLVMHPHTRAVGFTGSTTGGKQLFEWGNQRAVPIPVFAEMGSINPIFLLPEKLAAEKTALATTIAASVLLGVGQFCTNPGLIIALGGPDLDSFVQLLGQEITAATAGKMLHPGIGKAFTEKKQAALSQQGVVTVAEGKPATDAAGIAAIARTDAKNFLSNHLLMQEVFGPYSIVVACADATEMLALIHALEGQLTATVMATTKDILAHAAITGAIQDICGRFIMNSVPTGVEVCLSMQHGGPYPATTDSRYTSVGADAIKRFARPVAYQNWPGDLLPDALRDENPLGIWRTVDNELTKEPVGK